MGMVWRRASWAAKRDECSSFERGEAEQVIDDYMHRPADGVSGNRIVHGFSEDALPGESSIAMNQQRQIFFGAVSDRSGLVLRGYVLW